MATFGPQTIAADADCGYQEAGFFTAAFLFFGDQAGGAMHACMRWTNVTVPANATITSATLHIRARGSVTGTITNVHTKVQCHKGDAPVWGDGTFEPGTNFTATTATPDDWDPAVWVDGDYYDIDFTPQMQEVVNATWVSGYDLAVVLANDGSTTNNFARLYAPADADANAGTITIVYTAAGGTVSLDMWAPKLPANERTPTLIVGSGMTPPNRVS